MKKIVAMLLAVCLILGLAACAKTPSGVAGDGPYPQQTVKTDVAEVIIDNKGKPEKITIKTLDWGKEQPKVLADPKDVTLNFLMSKLGEDATGVQYEIFVGDSISYDYNNMVAVYDGPSDTEPDISVTTNAYDEVIGLFAADGYEDMAVKAIWGEGGIPDVFVRDKDEKGGVSILTEASQDSLFFDFDTAHSTMEAHRDPFGVMDTLFWVTPEPVTTDKEVFERYIGDKLDMSIYETQYQAVYGVAKDKLEGSATVTMTASNSYTPGNHTMLASYEQKWTYDISEKSFSAKNGVRYHYFAPTEAAMDEAIAMAMERLELDDLEYRTKKDTSDGWTQAGTVRTVKKAPLKLHAVNPIMAEVERSQTGEGVYEATIYIAYENGSAF